MPKLFAMLTHAFTGLKVSLMCIVMSRRIRMLRLNDFAVMTILLSESAKLKYNIKLIISIFVYELYLKLISYTIFNLFKFI